MRGLNVFEQIEALSARNGPSLGDVVLAVDSGASSLARRVNRTSDLREWDRIARGVWR